MTPEQALDEELALLEELAVIEAQQDMLAFTTYTKPDFEVNWHHKVCCDAIDFLEAGRTPRELLAHYGITGEELELQLAEPHPITKLYAGLTHPSAIDEPLTGLQIMLAPRHGKSEIVSRRMPAWWLGRNPDHALVCVSYSADLASRMNRDVQRIIDNPVYANAFPGTQLNGTNVRNVATSSWLRNSDIFEIVNHRGVYRSAGIGGGITGMGANCVAEGTLIATENGEIPIQNLASINPMPRVWAYNEETKDITLCRIKTVFTRRSSGLVTLGTAGGHSLSCTAEHALYTEGGRYIRADIIKGGERYLTIPSASQHAEDGVVSGLRQSGCRQ